MTNNLEKLLLELAELTTVTPVSSDIQQRLRAVIERNDLNTPETVPLWLLQLLTQVKHRQTTPWTAFPEENYNYSNVFTLIAELPEVLPVNYTHLEERILLEFPKLGMRVSISVEAGQYSIEKMA